MRLFFVGTNNPSINASRVAKRVMEGGHSVPIEKIISRYYKSISNCVAVSKFVDRTYVYDNSVDNREAMILFRLQKVVHRFFYLTEYLPFHSFRNQGFVSNNSSFYLN